MLFLSIHPKYVQAIIAGEKTVELRKRRPKAEPGSTVVIYATMPQCEVVGTATLMKIQAGSPGVLWPDVRDYSALSKAAFSAYFANADYAVAIHLADICVFEKPIQLSDPLCANIGETTLKFLFKLEGLENFDVRNWKKRSKNISGSFGESHSPSFYAGLQRADPCPS